LFLSLISPPISLCLPYSCNILQKESV
jgi:hypothetical protein